jgi:hypothetical protein
MRRVIVGIFSIFSGILGVGAAPSDYMVAETYSGLRSMVLNTKSINAGPEAEGELSVYGMLMETGHEKAVVTLVAMADDTVSLYFSNGGGIIGLGPHEGPRTVARELLKMAPQFVKVLEPAKGTPLPVKGNTRFYILTNKGIFTTEAKEEDFGYSRHALAPLFHKAHELIYNIQLVEQKLRTQKAAPSDGLRSAE